MEKTKRKNSDIERERGNFDMDENNRQVGR